MSQGQLLGLQLSYSVDGTFTDERVHWGSGDHTGLVDLTSDTNVTWSCHFCGFHFGEIPEFGGGHTYVIVPYWSIAVPLTLLAAVLILRPSRQTRQNPSPE